MRLVLHFAQSCRLLFTIFASWTVLETCTAENTSKIEPMDHIRGRRLVERVEQLVDTARRMAEMGLGYESARLLKSAAKYSPDKGRAEEAKRILEATPGRFAVRFLGHSIATESPCSITSE